jgi:hypothetical protein
LSRFEVVCCQIAIYGSEVGGLLSSLTHPYKSNGANTLNYLNELQKRARKVARGPLCGLPCSYREAWCELMRWRLWAGRLMCQVKAKSGALGPCMNTFLRNISYPRQSATLRSAWCGASSNSFSPINSGRLAKIHRDDNLYALAKAQDSDYSYGVGLPVVMVCSISSFVTVNV